MSYSQFDTIDDNYAYQLSLICSSYHHIDIHNIYKIINTLVYHLIYNNKFNDFNTQKSSIIETIKTSNKQILDKLENMQINSVKKILNKNGVFQTDDDFKCKHCNAFTGKNKASLGAHIRNCKFNPINNNNKSIGNIVINTSNV